jgi:tRNA threonylcarbamoyladenosine biosynthesis protein TsaE
VVTEAAGARQTKVLEGGWITSSEQETEALGARLAECLQAGDVVACFGELGSGKSVFIRGVCRGLAVTDPVTSPTFTLIHHYRGRLPVYHFDFYRIGSEEEARALGVEEFFYGEGVCVIEWAERVARLLPPQRVDVYLRHLWTPDGESKRKVEIVWSR